MTTLTTYPSSDEAPCDDDISFGCFHDSVAFIRVHRCDKSVSPLGDLISVAVHAHSIMADADAHDLLHGLRPRWPIDRSTGFEPSLIYLSSLVTSNALVARKSCRKYSMAPPPRQQDHVAGPLLS